MTAERLEIHLEGRKVYEKSSLDGALAVLERGGETARLIDKRLRAAGQGSWVGGDIGQGHATFQFDVTDRDAAVRTIRSALAKTQFGDLRTVRTIETVFAA
ncbi:MAG: hypothetical protein AAF919_16405 [Pseudomonadota bacterium]